MYMVSNIWLIGPGSFSVSSISSLATLFGGLLNAGVKSLSNMVLAWMIQF